MIVDDGQQRVAHHVTAVDGARREPLRVGRAHVVLVLDVEHRCAGDARDDRQRDRPERDRGKDQVLDRVPGRPEVAGDDPVEDVEVRRVRRLAESVLAADAREPAEPHGEHVLEDDREEEDRDRDPDQRSRKRPAWSKPDRYRLAERKPSGTPTEIAKSIAAIASSIVAGKRCSSSYVIVRVRRDAGAEVAAADRLQVVPVLDVDGLVEPVLMTDLCDGLWCGVLAEQRLGGRSRAAP